MFLTLLQSQGAPPPPPVILEPQGGFKKKRKPRFDDEIAARNLRRSQVIDAFEVLVEGRAPVVAELREEFATPEEGANPRMDWDKVLNDADAVRQIWEAYLDADDEDVLLLI